MSDAISWYYSLPHDDKMQWDIMVAELQDEGYSEERAIQLAYSEAVIDHGDEWI